MDEEEKKEVENMPAKGRQAYIVCPLIDEGESELLAAEKYAKAKETFLKARGCMEDGHAAERISKEIAKLMEK